MAQTLSASLHDRPPPSELAPPVKALLVEGGIRATAEKTTIDLWLVRSLAATPQGQVASWAAVPEGALVGAVKLSTAYPDIRGRTIKPGVYTLRYGIQPANGDHLGVSPFREFLLLNPVAADTGPEPLEHDALVDLSAKTLGIAHPAVWSLDPPVAKPGEVPRIESNEAGHQAIILRIPLTRSGNPVGELFFGLILIGHIEA